MQTVPDSSLVGNIVWSNMAGLRIKIVQIRIFVKMGEIWSGIVMCCDFFFVIIIEKYKVVKKNPATMRRYNSYQCLHKLEECGVEGGIV